MAELSCGHAAGAGRRFCPDCGAPMVLSCPACGAPAEPGQRFCGECGTGLAGTAAPAPTTAAPTRPEPPAAEGENKQVTVLVADVVGSMDLAERLAVDQLSEVMQGLFGVCQEAVDAFGGTVDKFTGDGIMALFGAPVALEDHADLAARAALRLIERTSGYAGQLAARGIALAVRVGLHSGEVVAGSVGEAFTAVGHTVGMAQRIQSLAEPGQVYLTEQTAALLSSGFRLRDLGPAAVSGSSRPVGVYALDGAVDSTAFRHRPSGSARMVGRDTELTTLQTALDAATGGRSQVIGIVGEAGTGKSRLCDELAAHATRMGIGVRRMSGLSHARDVELLPIRDLLRDYFAVAESDSAAAIRDQVANRLLALDPGFEPELGLLLDFMEVPDPNRPVSPMAADVRRQRILNLLRRVTARRSEQATLLFVLEDLHWFDPQSVEFVNAWLPTLAGSRTLVVMNFRPEFHAAWMGRSNYRQLALAPLDERAGAELLRELLGPDPELAELGESLVERAGGNPFFVEELVRGLAADGTLVGSPGLYRLARALDRVRIPPSVHAVLGARIDRLDAGDRAVLQAASVVGRTFNDAVLAGAVGRPIDDLAVALSTLCAAEMLQQTTVLGEYRFWHPLTQEVAYGSLLTPGRRRLHRAVADSLIVTAPDRLDELAALIATHYEAADERLAAAQWHFRAGTRAMRSDFAIAQTRLYAACAHLGTDPPGREAQETAVRARILLMRLGGRTGMDTAEQDQLRVEARAIAERVGDPKLLFGLALSDGSFRYFRGDVVGGAASWDEAFAWGERIGEREIRTFVRMIAGGPKLYTGPMDRALGYLEDAIAFSGTDQATGTAVAGYSVHDTAHVLRVQALTGYGQLRAAQRAALATLSFFDQRPMAEYLSWLLSLFAPIVDLTGEPGEGRGEAERYAQEATRLAAESGNFTMGAKAAVAGGLAHLWSGRFGQAAEVFTDALTECRKRQSGRLEEAVLLAHLARTHLSTGNAPDARDAADEAVAVARRQGAAVNECLAQWVRARVYRETATGDADRAQARAAVTDGTSLVETSNALTYRPFLAEEAARLDDDTGALRACVDSYEAVGAAGHAARLRAELAEV